LVVCAALLLSACGGGSGAAPSPVVASSPASVPASPGFADVTGPSNIDFRVGFTKPPLAGFPEILVSESTFGGTASGDCDGDHDIDLFITYGDTRAEQGGGPNRLYRNLLDSGNAMTFADSAATGGVANTRPDGKNDRHSGPAFADMDGDGDLDLFLGGIFGDPNRIYENLGDCRFVDVTANSLQIMNMRASSTISAAFGDYDLDGDLDMILTHWGTPDVTYEPPNSAASEHLWRNESDRTGIRFVNVSEESNVTAILWLTRTYPESDQAVDFTFAPVFARVDADEWPDILIAGDYGTSQILINQRDGTFRNLNGPALRKAQFGMGAAVGDVDDDGDLDWFVTSISAGDTRTSTRWGNRLFRNDLVAGTDPIFVDITEDTGIADGEWGWAACFLDIENDGDLDVFHTNGWTFESANVYGHDYSMDRSRAFVANGNGVFVDRAPNLGIDDALNSRGVVCADFDEDGDTDLLLLTDRIPNSAILWENRSAAAGRNYLRIRLIGLPPNTQAAGARLFLTANGIELMREINIGSGFISQSPVVQTFGLGSEAAVEALRIEWPAVIPAPGTQPVRPPDTVLSAGELALYVSRSTVVIRHPNL
jgi:hypothetical protein